jgi:tRNA threonylcarbamoyladenosine modification (KEOPS) complex  Pcc1 subunit
MESYNFKYRECSLTIEATSFEIAYKIYYELVANHVNEFQRKNRSAKIRETKDKIS